MPKSKGKCLYKDLLLDFSKTIPWRQFIQLLKRYGFNLERHGRKSGSGRIFTHDSGERFVAYEPHGREKWVHPKDRKKAWEAIERAEAKSEKR